jgi:acyl-coenzyme A synthetase/AMP-(fatty) acid ligase
VQEAAVIALPDDLIGNRLKAFVVPSGHNRLDEKELQTHLVNLLPRYMVPESIEFREELPKTSTGKINRPLLAKS